MFDPKCKAIERFFSTDETRPIFTGVHVTDTYIEATDSYRLARIDLDGAAPEDFPRINDADPLPVSAIAGTVLAGKAFIAALKAIPKRRTIPILHHAAIVGTTDGTVTLATTDLDTASSVAIRTIDETYPDTARLMPRDDDMTAQIALNPSFLKDLAAAFETFADYSEPVTLTLYGSRKPLKATMRDGDGRTMTALLMPCPQTGVKLYDGVARGPLTDEGE
jgi:DNA polymerase III sliding clamp (beta) subunit (PCNA family)